MKLQNANRDMQPSEAEVAYGLTGKTLTVRACDLAGQRIFPRVDRTVVVPISLGFDSVLHVPAKVIKEIPGDLSWSYNGPLCKSQQWRWVVQFPDMKELLDNAETVGRRKYEKTIAKQKRDGKKHQLIKESEYGFRSSCWYQARSLSELGEDQMEGLLTATLAYLNGRPAPDQDWANSLKQSTKKELKRLVDSILELLSGAQPVA